jgi:hypothetical protein
MTLEQQLTPEQKQLFAAYLNMARRNTFLYLDDLLPCRKHPIIEGALILHQRCSDVGSEVL